MERTRVGQVTDYERLILEVWTDGAVRPIEAVQQAAEKLVKNFFLFSKLNRAAEHGLDRAPLVVSPEVYQTPIENLQLSPRTLNCLKRAQINRVGEVLELSDDDLLKIRNFGESPWWNCRRNWRSMELPATGSTAKNRVTASLFPSCLLRTCPN